ncbi:BRISC complex subunit FAM175B-like [Copidosoma floridanum]|uniref:BRISC complex subunit FAM175B-like n=1 Tax=Copidosoma floridanum TaxID=29053 RepID=UPI0006C96099|nr:BRISC complex subunit FAM175B-like [Copidosoma floridanum]
MVNMTTEDLIVTISGPAFSMLLYENTKIHDQIGFLLGEVVVYVSKQVTDSDRDVETTRQHINIKNVLSHPIGTPFFDTIGRVNQEKLRFFLKDNVDKVVGWYRYQENFRIVSSTRDKALHYYLSKFFTNNETSKLVSEENFIFCNLTTSLSTNNGTHKFKQLFQRIKDDKLVPVSLRINNLGADASRPDGSDYKPVLHLSSCKSDAFQQVYDSISSDLKRTSGVESVTLIQKAAEKILQQLIPEVTKTDRMVSLLEDKLFHLRNDYYRKINEKAQLTAQMRKMEVDDTKTEVETPASPEHDSPTSPVIFDSPKSRTTTKTFMSKSSKLEKGDNAMEQTTTHKEEVVTCSNKNALVMMRPTKSPPLPATRGNHRTDPSALKISSMGRGASLCLRLSQDSESGRS